MLIMKQLLIVVIAILSIVIVVAAVVFTIPFSETLAAQDKNNKTINTDSCYDGLNSTGIDVCTAIAPLIANNN